MGERGWQTVGWAVAAVVAVLAAARLLDRAPDPPPVRVAGHPGEQRAGGAGPRGGGRPRLVVHVAGAVRRPGLYRVLDGARVADAIERAGGSGPLAALDLINLAAHVRDGQQVIVPAAAPGAPGLPVGAGPGDGALPLSLGSATAEQLAELDGIGPTLAERIVTLRAERGGFAAVADLADVEGIGEQRLAALEQALVP